MADDEELRQELADAAAAIGALARDEDTFRAAVDAFRAADRDSFQRLLAELEIAGRCRLVCEWIRTQNRGVHLVRAAWSGFLYVQVLSRQRGKGVRKGINLHPDTLHWHAVISGSDSATGPHGVK